MCDTKPHHSTAPHHLHRTTYPWHWTSLSHELHGGIPGTAPSTPILPCFILPHRMASYLLPCIPTYPTLYTLCFPTLPHHTVPYPTLIHHIIPCHATQYNTMPYHTIPTAYRTISYQTTPHHTNPHHTIPQDAIPCHSITYHTVLYHSIPHHTTCARFLICTCARFLRCMALI